jgi:hypothetical protein
VRQRDVVNRRLTELAAREEALALRERQIAEQRHIMSEEYRLLRQQQTERTAASARGHAGKRAFHGGSIPLANAARHSSVWQRIFRFFGGEAALRS